MAVALRELLVDGIALVDAVKYAGPWPPPMGEASTSGAPCHSRAPDSVSLERGMTVIGRGIREAVQ
jgi:hypothetical protein